ncbi:MAG: TonB-dependent receptor [Saprospiraceae bacterium]|nr:TonB-dependent receptor [Saprospiraceae bacterium]
MTKQFFCIWLLLFSMLSLSGQKKLIHGSVQDRKSKDFLTGALVGVGNIGTVTDELGKFKLELDESLSTLKVKMVGYQDLNLDITSGIEFIIFLDETSYLLNTTVITSSRFEKPISESSVSMSVIKSELSSKLNSNNVSQILDRVPGVQIIDGQANIRGGSGYSYGAGSRVLLLMDDLPALQSDAGFPNWDDLPLENIGQIEIVKGASSAVYGSSAMNGIIHFRSNYPASEPYTAITIMPRIFLRPENGNEWWGKNQELDFPYEGFVSFVHRQKMKSWDVSTSAAFTTKMGYNKNHDQNTIRVHGLIRKRLQDRLTLSVGLNFNKGESSSFFYWKDKGLFEGDAGSSSSSKKFRFTIDPTFKYVSKLDYHHSLRSRFYHVYNGADNNQSNQSENLYSEYQLSKNIQAIGIQIIGGILLNQSWTKAKLYSDTNFIHNNLAGFLQFEKKFFNRLILTAGLRYESYRIEGPEYAGGLKVQAKQSEDTVLFRFGLNYKVFETTFIRASFGQGYRFPTIAEKYISTKAGGLSIMPNPNLHSEHGFGVEIGLKQGFKIGKTIGFLDLAFFQSRYYDMMEFVLNNQLQFQSKNIGDTDIKGLELEFQTRTELADFVFTTSGGYTFIEPKYLEFDLAGKLLPINERDSASRGMQNAANSSSNENILKYRSKHLLRFDFQLDYKKLYGGISFNYASHVQAIDWLFELSLFLKGIKDYRAVHDHGYRVYDLRIGYHFKQLDLQVNLQNAFNEDYTIRPGIMDAPRNLSVRATYSY